MEDYYSILGVDKTASENAIKTAYRKLVMQHHPDKNNGDDRAIKKINAAYETLSNSQKRNLYDAGLHNGESSTLDQENTYQTLQKIYVTLKNLSEHYSSKTRPDHQPLHISDLLDIDWNKILTALKKKDTFATLIEQDQYLNKVVKNVITLFTAHIAYQNTPREFSIGQDLLAIAAIACTVRLGYNTILKTVSLAEPITKTSCALTANTLSKAFWVSASALPDMTQKFYDAGSAALIALSTFYNPSLTTTALGIHSGLNISSKDPFRVAARFIDNNATNAPLQTITIGACTLAAGLVATMSLYQAAFHEAYSILGHTLYTSMGYNHNNESMTIKWGGQAWDMVFDP